MNKKHKTTEYFTKKGKRSLKSLLQTSMVFISTIVIISGLGYIIYEYSESSSERRLPIYSDEDLHPTSTGEVVAIYDEESIKEFKLDENELREFADSVIKQNKYQAVYLINGQRYIGQLQSTDNPDFLILKDVFYLKFIKPDIGSGDGLNRQEAMLIKRGEELHRPIDTLYILKKNILFYEDMKSDSRILKSISDYHNR